MYPERLVTSGLRRSGRQPLPGTYGYGRLLGPSSRPAPGSASGSPPAGPPAGPALPWKTAFLVIALLARVLVRRPQGGRLRAEDPARQYQHR